MKNKLLICMTDLPFPVRKNGVSVRYSVIIDHLSRIFDIHLIVISNNELNMHDIKNTSRYVDKISIYTRRSCEMSFVYKLFSRIKNMFTQQVPLYFHCYDEFEIRKFISNEVKNKYYDYSLTVCSLYAHFILDIVRSKFYILDAIDSFYVYMYRKNSKNFFDIVDMISVRKWEKQLIDKMSYSSFVSKHDLSLLYGSSIMSDKVGVVPNGVYIDDYTSDSILIDGFAIGYLGNMSYPPNVDAVKRLVCIYLNLKKIYSDLKLFIIGRIPSKEILELNKIDGVIVTGTIDNIWIYVNAVDIFIFPLQQGAGQQNKLLETMFASRPVITTSVGNSGVGAINNESIIIANTNEEIISAVIRLYNSPKLRKKIGNAARNFVLETYSWSNILRCLDKNYFHFGH